ncbi:hypothetical protein ACRS6B_27445 [Nocardia asteroides]
MRAASRLAGEPSRSWTNPNDLLDRFDALTAHLTLNDFETGV